MATDDRPVVFLAFARSALGRYDELPRLPDESRDLRRRFERTDDRCRLVVRENATLDEILEVFQDPKHYGRIALFHFAGHADAFTVLLEDAAQRPMLVDMGGLATYLGRQPGLGLVVLNACETAAHAPLLLDAGIPAVIAADGEVEDDLAHRFAVAFYGQTLAGATATDAVAAAAGALTAAGAEPPFPWRLHTRHEQDERWKLPPAGPPPPPQPVKAEPPSAPRLFVGRQEALRTLDKWLDEVDRTLTGKVAVVYGPPGRGKRDLVRHWLAGLACRLRPPLAARTTFRPDEVLNEAAVDSYGRHILLTLAGRGLPPSVTGALPQAFRFENYPWVALAAQMVAGSSEVQAVLDEGPRWAVDLRLDGAALPTQALKELVRTAVAGGRPLVLVLEAFHLASPAWVALVQKWEEELRASQLPVLILLTCDHFEPLTVAHPTQELSDLLAWVRRLSAAPYFTVGAVYLSRLQVADVEALLAEESQALAGELHTVTEGSPQLIAQLLAHWQSLGQAEPQPDGRWLVDPGLPYSTPGALYDDLVEAPLQQCAERAQALGYELTAEHLLEWLNYAVWEGEVFTDTALARVVGWDGGAQEDFETVLDEALCDPDDEDAGLVRPVDHMELLPLPGEATGRDRNRYCVHPPIVAGILRQRQPLVDRQARGVAYAQALEQAYWPYRELVVGQLAALYDGVELPERARMYSALQEMLELLAQRERRLAELRAAAHDEWSKRTLLWAILDYSNYAYRKRTPSDLLPYLEQSLSLAAALHSFRAAGRSLYDLGLVYSALGDKQQTLAYYNQALPLLRQVGDKVGEAATLGNIGMVYSDLGDQQQALDYYNQALPLRRQIRDKAGEAATLHNIGLVYRSLGDPQQALDYYNQALPLFRQVDDKTGEAGTLTNIGAVYKALSDPQQALDYYHQALPLFRPVGDKAGEATTLNNIGAVYRALGDQQQALDYYNHALPLFRQVGDKAGEAATLTGIGAVYRALGDPQQALDYYNQALPLRRQVGDRYGESVTRFNIAMVAADLGDLDRAVAELEHAVALDEAIHHPDLVSDRAALARMRALRAARV